MWLDKKARVKTYSGAYSLTGKEQPSRRQVLDTIHAMKALLVILSTLSISASKHISNSNRPTTAIGAFILNAPSLPISRPHAHKRCPRGPPPRASPYPRMPSPSKVGSDFGSTCHAARNKISLLRMSTGTGENNGGPGAAKYMLHFLRRLGLGVAALGVCLGLMTLPAIGGVHAAMAPSLMQDEKGYISIFEKVCTLCMCSCLHHGGAHDRGCACVSAGTAYFLHSI